MPQGLLPMSCGEMELEIPEIVDAFGPQLNAIMSIGIFVVSCSNWSEQRRCRI